jgi:hypothetical protein
MKTKEQLNRMVYEADEEFFHTVGQNILKKEEQIFQQNRSQVAIEEQFRIKKVVVDGERTAI